MFRFLTALAVILGVAGCQSGPAEPDSDKIYDDEVFEDSEAPIRDVEVTVLSTNMTGYWSSDHDGHDTIPMDTHYYAENPDGSAELGPMLSGHGEPGSVHIIEGDRTVTPTLSHEGDPIGHEGWSSLIEVTYGNHRTRKILVDVGSRADILLRNARLLLAEQDDDGNVVRSGIEVLASVEEVLLTHWHYDHVLALSELRLALRDINPRALSTIYISDYANARREKIVRDDNDEIVKIVSFDWWTAERPAFEATFEGTGVEPNFVWTRNAPVEIGAGMWATGYVPRRTYDTGHGELEENSFPSRITMTETVHGLPDTEGGTYDLRGRDGGELNGAIDNVPDSISLVLRTTKGVVLVTGCGHAGIINITKYSQEIVEASSGIETPIHAMIGGFHLFASSRSYVNNVARVLVDQGLRPAYFLGGHCSGFNPIFGMREGLAMNDKNATIAVVGYSFKLSRKDGDKEAPVRYGQIAAPYADED